MAALPDSLGLLTSTNDPSALECFEHAVACLFRGDGHALAHIESGLACHPDLVVGHCLRAATLVLSGVDAGTSALAASIAAIEGNAFANERERRHAAAARLWHGGDAAAADRAYGQLLHDYPRDRLALLVAHSLDFRLGRRDLLRDRIARVLPHWDARDSEYGYVLGMLAFGLEETGDYDRALTTAHSSLQRVPDNAAAVHVIAHVLEMRGPPDEGIAWLRQTRPIWAANAGYRIHLAWHLALYQLDADAIADALATYDKLIAPRLDGMHGGLIDASALLWRLRAPAHPSDAPSMSSMR